MPPRRHLLTLAFFVDIDEGALRKRSTAGAGPSTLDDPDPFERAIAEAILADDTARWAVLSQVLGPLVAAELPSALSGALDVTPQTAAVVLDESGASAEVSQAFEDTIIDGAMARAIPGVLRAIRVLLVKADLLQVTRSDTG